MKSIVATLNHLINTANTLGNQTKDKKYFDKQAQLVSLLKNLQALEAQISNQTDDSLKALFKAAKQQIKAALAPLAGLSYPHEDFKKALNSAEFAHVSMANRVILGLKRNLELRNLAAKALQEKADAQKMQEYQDLCAKDAALLQAFQNNHALAMHEIQLANQRWAAYLQAAHDLKDLPENHVPKQTAKPSPVTDFFAPLLEAASEFFKSVSDSKFQNFKAPLMGFLGKIIGPIMGLFAKLLAPLFGSDQKAQEFAHNAGNFVVGLVDQAATSKQSTAPSKTPAANSPSPKAEGAPIVPAFNAHQAQSTPTPTTSPAMDLDDLVSTIFAKPKN